MNSIGLLRGWSATIAAALASLCGSIGSRPFGKRRLFPALTGKRAVRLFAWAVMCQVGT